MIVGGVVAKKVPNSTELYDPSTEIWTMAGNINVARYSHRASILTNGKVLISSGLNAGISAELYDSSTGKWATTGSMNIAREHLY